jgi:predicted MPP superfamily phosphohydrolase
VRVAALADLHAGAPMMDESRIEQIVAATNDLAPDVTLLLGDYGPSSPFVTRLLDHADVARRLGALRARHGVFAVTGNHDWWEDDAAMRAGRGAVPSIARAFEAAGIAVMGNRVQRAGPVLVGGLDSTWAFGFERGADDPARAAVTFCGHTHGGQVRLLGYSPRIPSRFGNRYAWGHVREDGRDLVVSGGLGTTTLPVRFGVPPEITLTEISA